MADKLLTLSELADKYGVPRKTLVTWDSREQIHAAFKQDGNKYYDDKSEEFVNRLKQWKPRRKKTPAQIETADSEPATADNTAENALEGDFTAAETVPAVIVDESAAVDVELGKHAEKIRVLCEAIRLNSISVGFELIEAKKLVNHGDWGKWLAENFSDRYGLTEKTAENYIKVAKRFGRNSKFADVAYSKLLAMTKLPPGTEQDFLIEQASEGRSIANQSARQVKKSVDAFCAAATKQNETVDNTNVDATAENTPAVVDDTAAETAVDATADTPAQIETADIDDLQQLIATLRRENDALRRENDRLKAALAARDTTPE